MEKNPKIVIGGLAGVAVLVAAYFGAGGGLQGRISLREEIPVANMREGNSFDREVYSRGNDGVVDNTQNNTVIPVSTVTAKTYGSVDSTGEFKLVVCAPSDLANVHLTYKSVGKSSKDSVYAGYSPAPVSMGSYLIPEYNTMHKYTSNKESDIDESSVFFLSKSSNSDSCSGGVEWIITVPNFASMDQYSVVPYFTGNVVVYVEGFNSDGKKLAPLVIVSQQVPQPENAQVTWTDV